jgi:hypothetical protein
MMEEATTGLQQEETHTSQQTQQQNAQKAPSGPSSSSATPSAAAALPLTQQQKAEMFADEDPLLISQSLTYVTDDGSVLHSFQSAPYATSA